MSVSFSGLTSGLNTDEIINQLLAVDLQPIQRYEQDITENESLQSSFRDLNTKVGSLADTFGPLTDPSTFKQKTASSSNEDVLEASIANSDRASTGTHEVLVNQKAKKASVKSGAFINDQKMFGTNAGGTGVTSMSDFEMVEGTGTLNPSSDWLEDLSKNVSNTDGANDFTINGTGFDLGNYNNFDELETAIESNTTNLDFGYDSTKDKFFLMPTNKNGNGGDDFTVQDNASGNGSNFFQQLGITTDDTQHTFDTQQSVGTDTDGDGNPDPLNLMSVDGNSSFNTLQFTSSLSQTDGRIRVNNTEIEWDSDPQSDNPNTINALVDEISEQVDGVTANFNSSTDEITLETTEPGAGNIDVSDAEGNLGQVLNLQADGNTGDDGTEDAQGQTFAKETLGQDSRITFNGSTITGSDNTVTVDGIELNLKQTETSNPVEVSIEDDTESVVSNVDDFVSKFNETIKFINENSQEQAPDSVDDSSENQSGPFLGDTTVRALKTQMTTLATQRYGDATDGGNDVESLADVGIELVSPLDAEDGESGTLTFDKIEFQNQLRNNPEQVREVFSALEVNADRGGEQDGAAVQLESYLDGISGSTGIISDRVDGIDSRIDSLNERISDQEDRILRKKSRLESKFRRMEETLAQLQEQQSFLGSRL